MTQQSYIRRRSPGFSDHAYLAMESLDFNVPNTPATGIAESPAFEVFLIEINGATQKSPVKNARKLVPTCISIQTGLGLTYSNQHTGRHAFQDDVYGRDLSFKNIEEFLMRDWRASRADCKLWLKDRTPDTSNGWDFTHPLGKFVAYKIYLLERIQNRLQENKRKKEDEEKGDDEDRR